MPSATYGTYNETDIANRFLDGIGAPHTPDMQRAVIAWMRFESGKGSVTANNPWNLTGSLWNAIVGYWRGGSATEQHDFPVFATMFAGVDAAAQNLMGQSYGYPKAVAAARSGDSAGFLQALAQSQWCTCHYQQWQTRQGAQAAINGIVPGKVTSHAPGTMTDATLTGFTSGKDATAIVNWLASYFKDHSSDVGSRTWGDFFNTPNPAFIGMPVASSYQYARAIESLGWSNKTIQLSDFPKLAAAIAQADPNAPGPLDWTAGVASFFAAVLDPTHWARFLAIAGGAGLIVWGGKIVWEASA